MTFRHCGGRASPTALRGHPGPGAGVRERLDRGEVDRARLERPERRVALHVPLHDTGLEHLAGRERRSADHAVDVLGERLLVAHAVHHGRDRAAVPEDVRGRGDRRTRVHGLRRDDPELAGRDRARVARRVRPPGDLARADEPEPVTRDRVDVRLVEVERPHLDVVQRREVCREQRPDGTAADHADPHGDSPRATAGRCGRRATKRELATAGQTGRAQDEHEPHQKADDDDARSRGQVDRPTGDAEAVLGLRQQRVETRDRERADDGAPQARHAADHEHRERDEGQIEVERVGAGGQEVHVEAAGEPCQQPRDGERDEPLPVDGDPHRAGRGGIVPCRPQLPPEPASLVHERGDDDEQRADRRLKQAGRLGNRGERRSARGRSCRCSGGRCS